LAEEEEFGVVDWIRQIWTEHKGIVAVYLAFHVEINPLVGRPGNTPAEVSVTVLVLSGEPGMNFSVRLCWPRDIWVKL
jgi:hypothetical protein